MMIFSTDYAFTYGFEWSRQQVTADVIQETNAALEQLDDTARRLRTEISRFRITTA